MMENGGGEVVEAGEVAGAVLVEVEAMEATRAEAVAARGEGKAWGAEGEGCVMEMEVGTMENGRGEVVEAVKVAGAALVERAVAVEAVTVGVMAVASQNPQISSLLVVAATEAARVEVAAARGEGVAGGEAEGDGRVGETEVEVMESGRGEAVEAGEVTVVTKVGPNLAGRGACPELVYCLSRACPEHVQSLSRACPEPVRSLAGRG